MRSLAALISLVTFGCGGASATGTLGDATLPMLDEMAVYDVPLAEADRELRASWERAERLLAADLPPGERDIPWFTDALRPWLRGQLAELAELDAIMRPLRVRGEPRDQLFASLVFAETLAHVYGLASEIELPATLAPETRAELASAWAEALLPLRERAHAGYQRCARQADAAPPTLSGWGSRCAARAATLRRAVELPRSEE